MAALPEVNRAALVSYWSPLPELLALRLQQKKFRPARSEAYVLHCGLLQRSWVFLVFHLARLADGKMATFIRASLCSLSICRRQMDDDYHFAAQFTADLIAMNHTDFIITSTFQEIAGTEVTYHICLWTMLHRFPQDLHRGCLETASAKLKESCCAGKHGTV